MRRGTLLLLGIATLFASSLVGHRTLSAHMAEHLLITMVAAPLLAACEPIKYIFSLLPSRRRWLAQQIAKPQLLILMHPFITGVLFSLTILAVHIPGFYDTAVRNDALHLLQHTLLLSTALLFWISVIDTLPLGRRISWPTRMLALLIAMPTMSVIGVALTNTNRLWYSSYSGPAALADQHLAGTIMWLGGAAIGAVTIFSVSWFSLVAEEKRQQRRERYMRTAAKL